MQLRRFVGFIDIGIAVVILVAILLPAREVHVSPAFKATEAELFALALAEARTIAHSDDGGAVDELAHRLGAARMKDWALEVAVRGSERTKQSPTAWRALQAASVAYVDRLDVVPALEYANGALAACDRVEGQVVGKTPACPSWEQVRMRLYQQHLAAGVASGIDPRTGPEAAKAFRRAGESTLRQIHLGGREVESGRAPAPGDR